jgi:hypothetical protein
MKDIIDRSGYPLQIKLEEVVRELDRGHVGSAWHILFDEHRWVNGDREGYVDLVLRSNLGAPGFDVRLVIECKRNAGTWSFLTVPGESPRQYSSALKVRPTPLNFHVAWGDVDFYPVSQVSRFCVMGLNKPPNKGGGLERDPRLLEDWAGDLLLATEALAVEDGGYTPNSTNAPWKHVYVPVIVTTADLQFCAIDPAGVSLEDGLAARTDTVPADVVRFRKNMATSLVPEGSVGSLEQAHEANQRTVFVVKASEFAKFLQSMQLC